MKQLIRYTLLTLISACSAGLAFAQTAGTNYTRTRVPLIPVTDASKLDTIPITRQLVSINYMDGLGRALQAIQVQGSPSLNDMIMPYVYDNLGRSAKNYLPYARQGTTSSNAGDYQSGAVSGVLNFYNPSSPGAPKIPTDTVPYARTVYEASPMGRVLEQGAVGGVFQPGTGHTVRATYGINVAGETIKYYHIDSLLNATASAYLPGVLTKTVITDENGHRYAVWKDLQGRTVSRAPLDAFNEQVTDYTYNDLGQLVNVLTPAGHADFDFVNESYAFRYDSIGRVTEKLTPGKGWEYMVYNHSDKLVLSQDSNMRAKHQWNYLKYDAEGRVVQTGIYTNATVIGRKALQYLVDTSYPTLWETWQPGTGYTNNAFPTSGTALYTTYYYDDYTFSEAAGKPFQSNAYGTTPTGRTVGMLTGASVYVLGSAGQYLATVNYYDNQSRLIQQIGDNHLGFTDVVNNQYDFSGELTGSLQVTTAISGSPTAIRNRYVYDPQGRLMDTYTSFQGGAEVNISHNVYNEVDQKVSEGLQYTGNLSPSSLPASATNITETTTVTMGKSDIVTKSVTLSPNFHFAATAGNSYHAAIGYRAGQMQEFRYNIRGWLTNINNGTLTNDGVTQSDPNALFGESITYWENSPLSGNVPRYDGNIASITWRNKIEASGKPGVATGGQGFNLEYDEQNRLYRNYYHTESSGTFTPVVGAFWEFAEAYDLMGNIGEIYRTDKAGTMINDQFYNYRYHSNLLDSLRDNGTNNISGSFTYDGNGNMTGDSHKGITISYNYLDLPDTVTKGSSKLVFGYDAAGNKLYKKLIVGGTVTAQRHYVENLEATATTSMAYDGRIDNVLMDEGRIVNTDSGYRYEYYLQDHLGNNRVMFRTDSLGQVRLSMVQNYYPFGSAMGDSTMNYSLAPDNQYKYSSKEFQPELDLNSYDFGARHYDPILGRWMQIDPLALLSEELSPYNYVEGNPLNMVDPDGMQPGSSGPDFTFGSSGSTPADGLGGITRSGGSAGSFGWGGTVLGGVTFGAQFVQSMRAFSSKTTTIKDWANGTGGAQGNGAVRSSIPQGSVPHPPPAPRQATIYATPSNGWTDLKNSGILGKFTYDIMDEPYITAHNIFWPYTDTRHINGDFPTPKENVGAFGNTVALFIPLSKGGFFIKAVEEGVAEKGVIKLTENASEHGVTEIGETSFRTVTKDAMEDLWGSNPEGAIEKLKTVSASDVEKLKAAGVTLKQVEAWRAFYKGAINKVINKSNRTAYYRMILMDKLIKLW